MKKNNTDDSNRLKENVQATQAQRHAGEASRFAEGDAVTVNYDELQLPGVVTGWVRRRVNIDTGVTVCVRMSVGRYVLVDAARVKKVKGAKK